MMREGRGAKKPVGGGPRVAAPAPSEAGPPWGIYITLILLVVIAMCAGGGWLMYENHLLAGKISSKQEELKKYEGAREKVGELEKKKQEYTAKVDQIKQLKDRQSVPVKLMNRLVEVLPDGAWYTDVSQADSKGIVLNGMAKGIKTISMFYDNLVATPEFGEVQLGDVNQQSGLEDVYSFKLTFNYYPGGVRPKEEPKPAAAAAPPPRRKASSSEGTGE